MDWLNLLVIVLSAAGWWISLYFTGVFYRWFKPDQFWLPKVCRLDNKTCATVLETPRAKMFGLPNSLFGLFAYGYYVFDQFTVPSPWPGLMLASLALFRSVYLFYSLLFVTRIPCVLCFTSHAINLVIFAAYVSELI